MPDAGRATCGQKCDLSYSADIDGCRFQYGNDPADADALADCIQEAKDDHQSCLGDCANPAISPPSWWRLAGSTLIVRCFGPSRNRSSVDGLLTVSGAILPASAMGEHEQWKICPLGLVDCRGCRWAQPRAHLFHGWYDKPVPTARSQRGPSVGAGAGTRRSGHCSSVRVRRPAGNGGANFGHNGEKPRVGQRLINRPERKRGGPRTRNAPVHTREGAAPPLRCRPVGLMVAYGRHSDPVAG